MTREHADALFVAADPVFSLAAGRIVELAASHKLPAIYQSREFVAVGGLMSYGPDRNDLFRRAATYVDKILKGAKPADLPVEQPTKFELVVNLKTAQALGLTIPPIDPRRRRRGHRMRPARIMRCWAARLRGAPLVRSRRRCR